MLSLYCIIACYFVFIFCASVSAKENLIIFFTLFFLLRAFVFGDSFLSLLRSQC
jgi:hypothetical protein